MKITQEERKEVIDMYNENKYRIYEIAEWIGISVSSVVKIVREHKDGKN